MDLFTSAYAHVCGQGRCFVADGAALPVCQRCMGLYVGAALTSAWIFSFHVWRRGLPSWRIFLIHAVILLTAMLGGIHVLDFGPSWRLLCGLWTGHAFVLWLVGSAQHLRNASLSIAPTRLGWSPRDEIHSMLAIMLLPALAFALPRRLLLGWQFWTVVITAGALTLMSSVVGAAIAITALSVRAMKHPCAVSPTLD